jgi:KDO2-lipid IV(A) lauroyltransferase
MYYLVYGFIYALSLLPLKVLYLLSDFAYFILYYVMKYRKEVVMKNLDIAFPQKSGEEKKAIAKKFYLNFTDTFIETIKLFSASKAWINRHVKADYSILHELHAQGRKCQIHSGHNFNWEIANLAFMINVRQKLMGVYMPLGNKVFDRLFVKLRGRFGTVLLPATNMRNAIEPHLKDVYILGLVADQSPANPKAGFWINFFGRPSAFVGGPEKGARAGDLAVIYAHFTKIKRGYYHLHLERGIDHPAGLEPGALTVHYARYLERVMTATPDMWLWSHRRWKLEWKEEYGPVLN